MSSSQSHEDHLSQAYELDCLSAQLVQLEAVHDEVQAAKRRRDRAQMKLLDKQREVEALDSSMNSRNTNPSDTTPTSTTATTGDGDRAFLRNFRPSRGPNASVKGLRSLARSDAASNRSPPATGASDSDMVVPTVCCIDSFVVWSFFIESVFLGIRTFVLW